MSISLEQFPLLESERDKNKKPMDTHPPAFNTNFLL
jgi:hypothetical protein